MTNPDADNTDVDDEWMVSLGGRLQRAREKLDMSQDEVAKQLGFPIRSLTRWENGHSDPGARKVSQLADFYGVSTDWLCGRTDIAPTIRGGAVLVNDEAVRQVEDVLALGGVLSDLPKHLVRAPGLDCSIVVPKTVSVFSADAFGAVDARMQKLLSRLKGQRR